MGPQALSHRSTSPVSHFKALKLAIHKHHPPLVHAGIQRQRTGVQAIHLTITHTGLELLMLFKDSMRGRNGAKFLLNSRKCIDKSHMPFTKSQAEFKGRAGPGPGIYNVRGAFFDQYEAQKRSPPKYSFGREERWK
eukprot:scaffold283820_cov15-Tisochrysis_lutea.AAC.1